MSNEQNNCHGSLRDHKQDRARAHTRSSGPVHETRPLAMRSRIRGRAFKGMAAVGEVSLAVDTCGCLGVDTSRYGTGERLSGGAEDIAIDTEGIG